MGGALLSGDPDEDYKGYILRPLVMLLITKERLSQLTLSYCSLFTLNERGGGGGGDSTFRRPR